MSAYKQLTNKDIIVSPLVINKTFNFVGSEMTGSNVGIDFYEAVNIPQTITFTSNDPTTGVANIKYQRLVYNNVKQLYYTNYIPDPIPTSSYQSSSLAIHSRFDNFLQSTLYKNRYFPTESYALVSVIDIPQQLYGEGITPSTFTFSYGVQTITDDGEGNLISASAIVGDIFYSHGIAIITTGSLYNVASLVGINGSDYSYDSIFYEGPMYDGPSRIASASVSFQSNLTIYEHQYRCSISENEFLFSLNPTLLSGSTNEVLYNFVTGSYFSPYITTVGLYNDNQELLAVAKLSSPLQGSSTTDTNIIVNFDM
jgi:hypothetical protein